MKSAKTVLLAFITVPDTKTAKKLAKAIVSQRLAACVNWVPKVESCYWWKGKIETSGEILLMVKTTARRWKELQKWVQAKHPYETPELIAFHPVAGSKAYLQWVVAETKKVAKKRSS